MICFCAYFRNYYNEENTKYTEVVKVSIRYLPNALKDPSEYITISIFSLSERIFLIRKNHSLNVETKPKVIDYIKYTCIVKTNERGSTIALSHMIVSEIQIHCLHFLNQIGFQNTIDPSNIRNTYSKIIVLILIEKSRE